MIRLSSLAEGGIRSVGSRHPTQPGSQLQAISLTTPVQVRGMIQVLAAYRIQGFCWCCFSDSSIAFRNCSTAATCGESNEPFAMYRHTGAVSSGYSPPPRYTSKV